MICDNVKKYAIYNGVQEDHHGNPFAYTFTDKQSGTTFLIRVNIKNLSLAIKNRLIEIAKAFDLHNEYEDINI